ncbi:Uncharacterized protein Adt_30595 [Abeliophyllum distichum]|uniref:Uncharacterized protein n=1 Tax=Abeliophyllum distichum TaxID=126358 RepID=A0ABD1RBP0_9LAMI
MLATKLIAEQLKAKSGPPSIDECIEVLESFGLLEDDEKFHLFALSFLDQKRHRASYATSRTPQMKMKFLKFNFKTWCLKNAVMDEDFDINSQLYSDSDDGFDSTSDSSNEESIAKLERDTITWLMYCRAAGSLV